MIPPKEKTTEKRNQHTFLHEILQNRLKQIDGGLICAETA
jgi:hypothetical protein